ncbi:hypothetical protein N0V83_004809 [Neocucurbitaria cava]|uniref:tRNA(His) guanylyltransferase n=1 Tax=Neocucurbitaria cava TaxID=798079 RepID=A0A9W8YCP4_9PLEO|nr:hypothetical protein N0V83_004809 [Neocucurbitaria cava]
MNGHNFSRFTSQSHFDRPFDQRIHSAMLSTTTDLLTYFPQATVAYTQSDEITLVFPDGVQSFNDRVQKLASLAAGHCSVRFNLHLGVAMERGSGPRGEERGVTDEDEDGELAATEGGGGGLGSIAHFDARLFAVPSIAEALNNLIWRCRNDAVRNAITSFARTMYSTQEMHGKRTGELLDMMEREKGVRFEESVPKWAVEGCLLKRELVEHEGWMGGRGGGKDNEGEGEGGREGLGSLMRRG